ncbi:MAG: hypothetical protein IH613_14685 [Desulfuromonadales bacterium]|nr:hypothetical protein [Desulfuromonadales bacterium]
MSKAGLWPREKPRPTESNAEIRLYEAFADDLSIRDSRWYQNNNSLDHSPREQAHSFVKKLVSRLTSVNGFTLWHHRKCRLSQ